MARTPYPDPEAEQAYQDIQDQSSSPSHTFENPDGGDDPYSISKPGNSMLRDRALGPANSKTNKRNGY